MALDGKTKTAKQSLILSKTKAFKAQLIGQPDTYVSKAMVIDHLNEIEAQAKQQAKCLSLAEAVIKCKASNENDAYFKSLLQSVLYKIYVT